jgi:hypothetical protein
VEHGAHFLILHYPQLGTKVRSERKLDHCLSRSDIRLIQYLDASALGLVRRWRLIGYFPIRLLPPARDVCYISETSHQLPYSSIRLQVLAASSGAEVKMEPGRESELTAQKKVQVCELSFGGNINASA